MGPLQNNYFAHHIEDVELMSIRLKYFPANCTSLVQPLNQGITNSVNCASRRQLINRLVVDLRLKHEAKADVCQVIDAVCLLAGLGQMTNTKMEAN